MAIPDIGNNDLTHKDWQSDLAKLAYAFGEPEMTGRLKSSPEDFRVIETMPISPEGEGEHIWLNVTKVRQNTEQVVRSLAQFTNARYRDIGFSGLKDFQARTTQWFSVWHPVGQEPDWHAFQMPGVTLEHSVRHTRKLKRGTHSANRFTITLRDLEGDRQTLEHRLALISVRGVPNYFGPQRFGRNADNLRQACDLLLNQLPVKKRGLRSLLISAARSWIFNDCVSQRVREGTWESLYPGEPANLHATNSVFVSEEDDATRQRLATCDIHPTAPMVGDGESKLMQACPNLYQQEQQWLRAYEPLIDALIATRLDYRRRSLRCLPDEMQWQVVDQDLTLSFSLPRGQFATSVIRELVRDPSI